MSGIHRIPTIVGSMTLIFSSAVLANAYFDPGLLKNPDGAPAVENLQPILSGELPAGIYHVRIMINGSDMNMTRNIRFEKAKDKGLVACLPPEIYEIAQVQVNVKGQCALLLDAVPTAKEQFDTAKMTLSLSFPQSAQSETAADQVPQTLWDNGISAIMLGYQYSGNETVGNTRDNDNSGIFTSLKIGGNWESWRLRQTATVQHRKGERAQWETQDSYLERAIPVIKGELTLGESYTSGDLFDSLRIRGAQISSDTQMLPSSQNGFSPTIRGVANSNAVVTVSQNGYTLYQTNVGQGLFTLHGLAPVSSGGTLDVTVREADGSEHHFSQTYSSLTNLEREGGLKYNLALGRYSDANIKGDSPELAQFNTAYGLPHNMTLFSGAQFSQHYNAVSTGLGSEFGWLGAVSAVLTQEKSVRQSGSGADSNGYSVKTAWANYVEATGSNITISATQAYRRYLTLADAFSEDNQDNMIHRQFSLTLSQPLPGEISTFVSMNNTRYRNQNESQMYQFGLSAAIWKVMNSMTLSLNKDSQSDRHNTTDKQLFFNFSLPLSAFSPESGTTLTASMNSDLHGGSSQSLGASGNVANDPSLTWQTDVGYDAPKSGDDSRNGDLSLNYKGRYGEYNGGYTQDASQKQFIYGGSGEIVMHQHGLTLGQYSDGAMALVSAPGAAGIAIGNHVGIATDFRGYTTVPDITPYSFNEVQIDKNRIGKHVSFDSLATTVVPTKDAVVMAEFKPTQGRKVLFRVDRQGTAIPFGAEAKLISREKVYFVGDQGALFIDGAPDQGEIMIDDQQSHCRVSYRLPQEGDALVTLYHAFCVPETGEHS